MRSVIYSKQIFGTICKFILISLLYAIVPPAGAASESSVDWNPEREEGNHTWAKSEAWAWMGTLQVLDSTREVSQPYKMTQKGFGMIHYYTRNQTQFGHLNFKSSALTQIENGRGISFDKSTLYSDRKHQSKIRSGEGPLNLEFSYQKDLDKIYEVELGEGDQESIEAHLLPLYPGLRIANGFRPKKYIFQASVGSHSHLDLVLYQIWPSISPKNGRMNFLGLEDSYTFSQPMLIGIGNLKQQKNNDTSVTKVSALLYLDRQWARDYFGKNTFAQPLDALRVNRAMALAHEWSAFHAFASDTHNWYFVHLWQQYDRKSTAPDTIRAYTGVQWSMNGEQQPSLIRDEFSWTGSNFIKNDSKVMMSFAEGRAAYFPSLYKLKGQHTLAFDLTVEASPRLQSLDQPIYLFEGFAIGGGHWNSEKVQLQGRLESSRILFRNQDYQEMIERINETSVADSPEDSTRTEQENLRSDLSDKLLREQSCGGRICLRERMARVINELRFLFGSLGPKLELIKSGLRKELPTHDPQIPSIIIY